ncbi:MAG TPA: histidinol phosphate phosphatase domain-containing protein [Candidatus Altiarchaeales archaeon]|nr:histidinol phosphate phosphatase domain-containing protein [Candidatus Altiarchaeales archaeon]
MVDLGGRCEFHTHTFFSDGELGVAELVRRCFAAGCEVVALTDHVDFANIEFVLDSQKKMVDEISWDIKIIRGVELTHIPKDKIAKIVGLARNLGAQLVVGHGESPVEPVEEGTNLEFIKAGIDILAHPGKLSREEAALARKNNVFIELTSRRGHKNGNKDVAKACMEAGALMVVDTDAHAPEDIITQEEALKVARDAGLSKEQALQVVVENPKKLLAKTGF